MTPLVTSSRSRGYAKARDTDGAFLAANKVTGHLAYLLRFSKEELAVFKVEDRIDYT